MIRSPGKGVGSALTTVKAVSPEIAVVARDQGVVKLEVSIATGVYGKSEAAGRGRGPGRVLQRFLMELERAWRSLQGKPSPS